MPTLFYVAMILLSTSAATLFATSLLTGNNAETKRLQEVLARETHSSVERSKARRWSERSGALANKLRRTLSMRESQQIKVRLMTAGLRGSHASDIFFGVRCILPIVCGLLASFIASNTGFWVFALALMGYMAPDVWLTSRQKKRQNTIRRSLPDAVDLLVICVDAGLGLDQALLRVGQELAISHPEINQEFMQVHLEQRAGKPRLEAWQSLADRTGVDELAAFVSMLTQTDRFGTPILRALGRFSEEMRLKRRQHAEQAAAKTKIKIIFPLVLFIFPCIFIVLLAPAMIGIADGLKAMAK